MIHQKQKIKAAFLVVVFALNTVVSFACSVGAVDFSKSHHKQDAEHSHDKPHTHDHHESAEASNHHNPQLDHHATGEEAGSCCSDEVLKLQVADKNVTVTNQNPLPPSIELQVTLHTYILSLYNSEPFTKPAPPFLRWQAPPTIPDLRIAIQSFQI